MDYITTIYQNVNTVRDRKNVISDVLSQTLPLGLITTFLFHSFWHSLHFYNLLKKKYKNIIKFQPKHISHLKSINLLDYYTFLKLIISADKIPDKMSCLIFDLDVLMQSKYFTMYKTLFETELKFSSTLSTISAGVDYKKHIKFEKTVALNSNFNVKTIFKSIDSENFSVPKNSIFFCLNKNLLYTLIQKII